MKKFLIFCFLILLSVQIISAVSYQQNNNLTFYITLPDNLKNQTNSTHINSTAPTGFVITHDDAVSVYYLIPIVMTIAIIILLVVLVVIARLMHMNTMRHRIKPIVGIQQPQSG